MRLPPPRSKSTDIDHRRNLFRNLVRSCEFSRNSRAGYNRTWRTAYQTGTTFGIRARYNKLKEHIKESTADLYSAPDVKFSAWLPRRFGEKYLEEQDAAQNDFQDFWTDPASGAAATFGLGVEWAHVYPSSIYKITLDRNQPFLTLIPDPADFGVLQEELSGIQRQEAVCHWYTLSLPAYERMVRATIPNGVRAEELIRLAHENAEAYSNKGPGDAMPSAIGVILSTVTPTTAGVVPGVPDLLQPLEPLTNTPVVRMAELWVWDDDVEDDKGNLVGEWRVVTMHLPSEEVLFEKLNPLIPGEHAFKQLALDLVPGYAWANSPIDMLIPLQMWHEELIENIKVLMDMNIDSPIAATGVQGATDEQLEKLRAKGGVFISRAPGGKVERMAPPLPPDIFTWLGELNKMFSQQGGRPLPMRGMGDPSSRTGEQDLIRAALGSGPAMTKAMLVEACLADVATTMFRLRRRTYPHPLRKIPSAENPEGAEFLLSEIPADVRMLVDSHSHSPVYSQQMLSKVALAGQLQWLDPESGVDLLRFPMSQRIQARARARMTAAAERGAKASDVKAAEIESKTEKNKASAVKSLADARKVQ